MDTKETFTTTEEDVNLMKQELETKKAEVESLKEAMTVRMDLLTLAEGKVASLEIEKVELERELRKGKKIITTLREDSRKQNKPELKRRKFHIILTHAPLFRGQW